MPHSLQIFKQILQILNIFSKILTVYLPIIMVQYDVDREIMITYVKLPIVRSQFFTIYIHLRLQFTYFHTNLECLLD